MEEACGLCNGCRLCHEKGTTHAMWWSRTFSESPPSIVRAAPTFVRGLSRYRRLIDPKMSLSEDSSVCPLTSCSPTLYFIALFQSTSQSRDDQAPETSNPSPRLTPARACYLNDVRARGRVNAARVRIRNPYAP